MRVISVFPEKKKKIRKSIIFKLIDLFVKKYGKKYTKYFIALHLLKTAEYGKFIIKCLKKYFLIRSIKRFDAIPYNGVRGKKSRRKKYITKLPLR